MLKNFKWLVLWLFTFCLFTATAGADQITIINAALNGGSYTWDNARADQNNNFDDLYIHWTLITVTSPVDLDTMDALIDANVIQISELVTLSGVPAHSTDLGTFPGGTTIPDNSDNKEALAALEIAVEAAGPGVDENYVTDADLVTIGNQSGTNTDDATIGTANGLSFAGQVLSLAAATNGNPGAMTAAFVLNIESLITLSGVLADATDFGTFIGVTIPDGSTNKEALQALETAVEAGGASTWGAITGTLSNQTDLQNALDAKADLDGTQPIVTTDTITASEVIVPFVDGAAGVGWLDFNTSYTPAVGFTGFSPYIDNLYKVLDGSIVGILGEIDDTAGDGDTAATWSANKIFDELASISGVSVTYQTADPVLVDMSEGDIICARTSGDVFIKGPLGGWTLDGVYAADPVLYTLTITDPGNNDYIQSTDTFIDCGNGATDCTHDYASGATPELTATADTGRQYDNWTGDATDTSTTTNPDTITMDAAKGVSAAFSVTSGYTPFFTDDFNRANNTDVITGSSWTSEIDVSGIGSILNNEYQILADDGLTTRIVKTFASNNTDYQITFKVKLSAINGVDTSSSIVNVKPIQIYSAAGVFLELGFRTDTSGNIVNAQVNRINDAGSAQTAVVTPISLIADTYATVTIQVDIGEPATSDGIVYMAVDSTEVLNLTGLADETRPIVSEIRFGVPSGSYDLPATWTIDDFTYGDK